MRLTDVDALGQGKPVVDDACEEAVARVRQRRAHVRADIAEPDDHVRLRLGDVRRGLSVLVGQGVHCDAGVLWLEAARDFVHSTEHGPHWTALCTAATASELF